MTAPTHPAPLVSFVVPVRNDATRLRRCLASILANTDTRFEIVVVDNGSTDDSVTVAHDAGATVCIEPGLSVAQLRNAGAALATGDILAFVDADHEITPAWVSQARAILADAHVGITGTLCHAPADGTWVQRMYDTFRDHATACRAVEWLGSGNMAIRRDVFQHLHGFDTTLETCEDVDLCNRTRGLGWRIIDHPGMYNTHLGDPATLKALFVGELWRGRDNLRASLRALTLRGLPSVVIPVAHLALAMTAGLGVVSAPAGGAPVALVAVLLMAFLTLPRAIRMFGRLPQPSVTLTFQACTVAVVYDAARALALVSRVSHAGRVRAARA